MNPQHSSSDNPLETPGAQQMAAWTLRLAQSPGFGRLLAADPHLFALLYASCAAAVPAPEPLAGDDREASAADEKLLPALKDLQRQFGERTSGRFVRLYLRGTSAFGLIERDEGAFRNAMRDWAQAAEVEASRFITALDENVGRIAGLLDLTTAERDVLAFQIGRSRPGFSQLFELLMDADRATKAVLGAALGTSESEVVSALSEQGTLARSGLLNVKERPLRVTGPSHHLSATLAEHAEEDAELVERFVKPLLPSPSTRSLGRLHEHDRRILLGVLRKPLLADRGVHTLVYGPKSVDKRDMMARLLGDEGIGGHAVVTRHVPAGDMPTWTYIAQRHIERSGPDAVLVVDRAHEALASRPRTRFHLFDLDDELVHDDDPERASDEGLTESRVRCVWITDRARQLSERNLGAFLFHCEAFPGSRAERRARVAQVISDFGLSSQLERDLAKYSLLGEQQVRQAAELARLIVLVDDECSDEPAARRERLGPEHERVIKRAVAHSQKVLGRDRTEGIRDSVTSYDLDLLNIAGRFTPRQIIGALSERPMGSLCFWGMPGAGKTQLAEHIAVELDLPILMRSASELLSMWLGETEQQISKMFAEAQNEGALLFLDEADSFLRDRTLARAHWEVTQVNELLQRMERFEGIFIAATNLMDSIDAAAMRRFTWKLEFKALRREQAWSMFCRESGFDPTSEPDRADELEQALNAIDDLAPGDFATVRRQAQILGEELPPEAWIEQLAAEAKAKMLGLRRQQVGFGS
ncbi:MAG TPA: ATP-binding protein [Solirubrobacteraceae bacterium]|nr:ATP-binding protein [Solirubrobacteraceae bacterium]